MSYRSRLYNHRNAQSTVENDKPFFSKQNESNHVQKKGMFFQAKTEVNKPGDSYEQEADSVANAVVNNKTTTPVLQQKKISSIQRLSTTPEEEEVSTNDQRMDRDKEKPFQRMSADPEKEKLKGIQKMDDPMKEEDKKKPGAVQTKQDAGAGAASPTVSSKIESASGKGKALPAKTMHEMSSSFGFDFSNVHIHNDSEAAAMNKELQAQAFTHGSDIYFNQGKYNPENSEGKFLLAHELTHVVQQSGNLLDKVSGGQQISKSTQSVQCDFFDDITDKIVGAGESVVEGAQALGSTVVSGAEAVADAATSGSGVLGEVVDSAKQQVGSAADLVTNIGGSALQAIPDLNKVKVDWNSAPAIILKAWALTLDPNIVRKARGKGPADLTNLIQMPESIRQAAEELARISLMSDLGAAANFTTGGAAPALSPAPAPVVGSASGPVSGIRPIIGVGPGVGPAAAPAAGAGLSIVVFIAALIAGFILPFLIAYIFQHSEELNDQPDPDEQSKPGGAPLQSDSSGDAGASVDQEQGKEAQTGTAPSPKKEADEDSGCDTKHPDKALCGDLELDRFTIRGVDQDAAHDNAVDVLKKQNPGAKLNFRNPKAPGEVFPCFESGLHTNVFNPRLPRNQQNIGSINCCPCCQPSPGEPKVEGRCRITNKSGS